jgi:hypothetical protein
VRHPSGLIGSVDTQSTAIRPSAPLRTSAAAAARAQFEPRTTTIVRAQWSTLAAGAVLVAFPLPAMASLLLRTAGAASSSLTSLCASSSSAHVRGSSPAPSFAAVERRDAGSRRAAGLQLSASLQSTVSDMSRKGTQP